MVAIAYFLVFDIGTDNLPYYHRHIWITEDLNHAIIELVDYEKECTRLKQVSMTCFNWYLEERLDIGV